MGRSHSIARVVTGMLLASMCLGTATGQSTGDSSDSSADAAPNKLQGVVPYSLVIEDGVLIRGEEGVEATLENVLDVLRAAHPEINIVVTPDVPKLVLGDLKLRASDPRMELAALRAASGERFMWEEPPVQIDSMNDQGLDVSEQPLFILRPAPEMSRRLRVEAFSLSGYLASLPKVADPDETIERVLYKVAELEEIVDRTVSVYVEMEGGGDERMLNLKYHRGSDLLVLIGDALSVDIASKVVGALPGVRPSGGEPRLPVYGAGDFTAPLGGERYGRGELDAVVPHETGRGYGSMRGGEPNRR